MYCMCDAMNSNTAFKSIAAEIHKLLKAVLYNIISSTSQRTFSVLKRLLTYLRSTMTKKRLNNCMLLHVHKDITDQIDNAMVAKECISVNSERLSYLGQLQYIFNTANVQQQLLSTSRSVMASSCKQTISEYPVQTMILVGFFIS